MEKNIILLLALLILTPVAYPMNGKIALRNGHAVKGDIRKLPDGGYWVTNKSGSIKYDRNEVKSVRIFSTKDTVSENFISSMKITPGQAGSKGKPSASGYDNLISREAARNNIDPALVKAVIRAESNYNKNDVSFKGACGLMQLMPETARLMGVRSIFSPDENIEAGTRFLRYMIDAFGGDIEMGLAAYNAGPSVVKRYGGIPPYKETKNYVKNVFKYYRSYRGGAGKICSYTDEKGCLNLFNNK